MKYIFTNCSLKYELELMCCHFFPNEKPTEEDDGCGVIEVIRENDRYRVKIEKNGKVGEAFEKFSDCAEPLEQKRRESKAFKTAFWHAAGKVTDISVPWGILTGIRPSKPIEALLTEHGEQRTREILEDEFFTDESRISLGIAAAKRTLLAKKEMYKNGVSIYVGIPFCPSRCRYCSFVSHSIATAGALLPDYLKKLEEEIYKKGEIVKNLGLLPETLYIGGGTPAVISEYDIKSLFEALDGAFSLKNFREITFEAGRPDCITGEKAAALYSVSPEMRISVNPQSLNDGVLEKIGRNHTAEDFYRALYTVREAGLLNINSDVIAGLSGDSLESFEKTVNALINENIPSITVHTLSKKRAATEGKSDVSASETEKMVDFSRNVLTEKGFLPYYLYRQRNIGANLENVGYAKAGGECLYNIYMMEDIQTVLACGAGSVSKLKTKGNTVREANYKFPYEYLRNPHKENEVFYNVLSDGKLTF